MGSFSFVIPFINRTFLMWFYFKSDTKLVFSLILCFSSFTLPVFEYFYLVLLFLLLFTFQGRLRVPQDLCNTTMTKNCPFAMVLPCTTGMGVCSTSFTFFLVNANNKSL